MGRGVLVLHPWWGLNQTILDYAARLAGEGFVVLAPDLFGDGEPPATTVEDAERRATASEADGGVAVEQRALGAADWLVERTVGPIGVVGFSFGAAYALWLGAKRPDKIAGIVVYYGTAGPVKGQAPVLGHFATDDQFEPAENIDDLEKQLTEAEREFTPEPLRRHEALVRRVRPTGVRRSLGGDGLLTHTPLPEPPAGSMTTAAAAPATTRYEAVIGIEIHVQLRTVSKMFCACSTDVAGAPPNSRTCPVCLGLPGALPVINRRAVEHVLATGLAIGSSVPEATRWDRKNYFYPDLPKGYQISQYDLPLPAADRWRSRRQRDRRGRDHPRPPRGGHGAAAASGRTRLASG